MWYLKVSPSLLIAVALLCIIQDAISLTIDSNNAESKWDMLYKTTDQKDLKRISIVCKESISNFNEMLENMKTSTNQKLIEPKQTVTDIVNLANDVKNQVKNAYTNIASVRKLIYKVALRFKDSFKLLVSYTEIDHSTLNKELGNIEKTIVDSKKQIVINVIKSFGNRYDLNKLADKILKKTSDIKDTNYNYDSKRKIAKQEFSSLWKTLNRHAQTINNDGIEAMKIFIDGMASVKVIKRQAKKDEGDALNEDDINKLKEAVELAKALKLKFKEDYEIESGELTYSEEQKREVKNEKSEEQSDDVPISSKEILKDDASIKSLNPNSQNNDLVETIADNKVHLTQPQKEDDLQDSTENSSNSNNADSPIEQNISHIEDERNDKKNYTEPKKKVKINNPEMISSEFHKEDSPKNIENPSVEKEPTVMGLNNNNVKTKSMAKLKEKILILPWNELIKEKDPKVSGQSKKCRDTITNTFKDIDKIKRDYSNKKSKNDNKLEESMRDGVELLYDKINDTTKILANSLVDAAENVCKDVMPFNPRHKIKFQNDSNIQRVENLLRKKYNPNQCRSTVLNKNENRTITEGPLQVSNNNISPDMENLKMETKEIEGAALYAMNKINEGKSAAKELGVRFNKEKASKACYIQQLILGKVNENKKNIMPEDNETAPTTTKIPTNEEKGLKNKKKVKELQLRDSSERIEDLSEPKPRELSTAHKTNEKHNDDDKNLKNNKNIKHEDSLEMIGEPTKPLSNEHDTASPEFLDRENVPKRLISKRKKGKDNHPETDNAIDHEGEDSMDGLDDVKDENDDITRDNVPKSNDTPVDVETSPEKVEGGVNVGNPEKLKGLENPITKTMSTIPTVTNESVPAIKPIKKRNRRHKKKKKINNSKPDENNVDVDKQSADHPDINLNDSTQANEYSDEHFEHPNEISDEYEETEEIDNEGHDNKSMVPRTIVPLEEDDEKIANPERGGTRQKKLKPNNPNAESDKVIDGAGEESIDGPDTVEKKNDDITGELNAIPQTMPDTQDTARETKDTPVFDKKGPKSNKKVKHEGSLEMIGDPTKPLSNEHDIASPEFLDRENVPKRLISKRKKGKGNHPETDNAIDHEGEDSMDGPDDVKDENDDITGDNVPKSNDTPVDVETSPEKVEDGVNVGNPEKLKGLENPITKTMSTIPTVTNESVPAIKPIKKRNRRHKKKKKINNSKPGENNVEVDNQSADHPDIDLNDSTQANEYSDGHFKHPDEISDEYEETEEMDNEGHDKKNMGPRTIVPPEEDDEEITNPESVGTRKKKLKPKNPNAESDKAIDGAGEESMNGPDTVEKNDDKTEELNAIPETMPDTQDTARETKDTPVVDKKGPKSNQKIKHDDSLEMIGDPTKPQSNEHDTASPEFSDLENVPKRLISKRKIGKDNHPETDNAIDHEGKDSIDGPDDVKDENDDITGDTVPKSNDTPVDVEISPEKVEDGVNEGNPEKLKGLENPRTKKMSTVPTVTNDSVPAIKPIKKRNRRHKNKKKINNSKPGENNVEVDNQSADHPDINLNDSTQAHEYSDEHFEHPDEISDEYEETEEIDNEGHDHKSMVPRTIVPHEEDDEKIANPERGGTRKKKLKPKNPNAESDKAIDGAGEESMDDPYTVEKNDDKTEELNAIPETMADTQDTARETKDTPVVDKKGPKSNQKIKHDDSLEMIGDPTKPQSNEHDTASPEFLDLENVPKRLMSKKKKGKDNHPDTDNANDHEGVDSIDGPDDVKDENNDITVDTVPKSNDTPVDVETSPEKVEDGEDVGNPEKLKGLENPITTKMSNVPTVTNESVPAIKPLKNRDRRQKKKQNNSKPSKNNVDVDKQSADHPDIDLNDSSQAHEYSDEPVEHPHEMSEEYEETEEIDNEGHDHKSMVPRTIVPHEEDDEKIANPERGGTRKKKLKPKNPNAESDKAIDGAGEESMDDPYTVEKNYDKTEELNAIPETMPDTQDTARETKDTPVVDKKGPKSNQKIKHDDSLEMIGDPTKPQSNEHDTASPEFLDLENVPKRLMSKKKKGKDNHPDTDNANDHEGVDSIDGPDDVKDENNDITVDTVPKSNDTPVDVETSPEKVEDGEDVGNPEKLKGLENPITTKMSNVPTVTNESVPAIKPLKNRDRRQKKKQNNSKPSKNNVDVDKQSADHPDIDLNDSSQAHEYSDEPVEHPHEMSEEYEETEEIDNEGHDKKNMGTRTIVPPEEDDEEIANPVSGGTRKKKLKPKNPNAESDKAIDGAGEESMDDPDTVEKNYDKTEELNAIPETMPDTQDTARETKDTPVVDKKGPKSNQKIKHDDSLEMIGDPTKPQSNEHDTASPEFSDLENVPKRLISKRKIGKDNHPETDNAIDYEGEDSIDGPDDVKDENNDITGDTVPKSNDTPVDVEISPEKVEDGVNEGNPEKLKGLENPRTKKMSTVPTVTNDSVPAIKPIKKRNRRHKKKKKINNSKPGENNVEVDNQSADHPDIDLNDSTQANEYSDEHFEHPDEISDEYEETEEMDNEGHDKKNMGPRTIVPPEEDDEEITNPESVGTRKKKLKPKNSNAESDKAIDGAGEESMDDPDTVEKNDDKTEELNAIPETMPDTQDTARETKDTPVVDKKGPKSNQKIKHDDSLEMIGDPTKPQSNEYDTASPEFLDLENVPKRLISKRKIGKDNHPETDNAIDHKGEDSMDGPDDVKDENDDITGDTVPKSNDTPVDVETSPEKVEDGVNVGNPEKLKGLENPITKTMSTIPTVTNESVPAIKPLKNRDRRQKKKQNNSKPSKNNVDVDKQSADHPDIDLNDSSQAHEYSDEPVEHPHEMSEEYEETEEIDNEGHDKKNMGTRTIVPPEEDDEEIANPVSGGTRKKKLKPKNPNAESDKAIDGAGEESMDDPDTVEKNYDKTEELNAIPETMPDTQDTARETKDTPVVDKKGPKSNQKIKHDDSLEMIGDPTKPQSNEHDTASPEFLDLENVPKRLMSKKKKGKDNHPDTDNANDHEGVDSIDCPDDVKDENNDITVDTVPKSNDTPVDVETSPEKVEDGEDVGNPEKLKGLENPITTKMSNVPTVTNESVPAIKPLKNRDRRQKKKQNNSKPSKNNVDVDKQSADHPDIDLNDSSQAHEYSDEPVEHPHEMSEEYEETEEIDNEGHDKKNMGTRTIVPPEEDDEEIANPVSGGTRKKKLKPKNPNAESDKAIDGAGEESMDDPDTVEKNYDKTEELNAIPETMPDTQDTARETKDTPVVDKKGPKSNQKIKHDDSLEMIGDPTKPQSNEHDTASPEFLDLENVPKRLMSKKKKGKDNHPDTDNANDHEGVDSIDGPDDVKDENNDITVDTVPKSYDTPVDVETCPEKVEDGEDVGNPEKLKGLENFRTKKISTVPTVTNDSVPAIKPIKKRNRRHKKKKKINNSKPGENNVEVDNQSADYPDIDLNDSSQAHEYSDEPVEHPHEMSEEYEETEEIDNEGHDKKSMSPRTIVQPEEDDEEIANPVSGGTRKKKLKPKNPNAESDKAIDGAGEESMDGPDTVEKNDDKTEELNAIPETMPDTQDTARETKDTPVVDKKGPKSNKKGKHVNNYVDSPEGIDGPLPEEYYTALPTKKRLKNRKRNWNNEETVPKLSNNKHQVENNNSEFSDIDYNDGSQTNANLDGDLEVAEKIDEDIEETEEVDKGPKHTSDLKTNFDSSVDLNPPGPINPNYDTFDNDLGSSVEFDGQNHFFDDESNPEKDKSTKIKKNRRNKSKLPNDDYNIDPYKNESKEEYKSEPIDTLEINEMEHDSQISDTSLPDESEPFDNTTFDNDIFEDDSPRNDDKNSHKDKSPYLKSKIKGRRSPITDNSDITEDPEVRPLQNYEDEYEDVNGGANENVDSSIENLKIDKKRNPKRKKYIKRKKSISTNKKKTTTEETMSESLRKKKKNRNNIENSSKASEELSNDVTPKPKKKKRVKRYFMVNKETNERIPIDEETYLASIRSPKTSDKPILSEAENKSDHSKPDDSNLDEDYDRFSSFLFNEYNSDQCKREAYDRLQNVKTEDSKQIAYQCLVDTSWMRSHVFTTMQNSIESIKVSNTSNDIDENLRTVSDVLKTSLKYTIRNLMTRIFQLTKNVLETTKNLKELYKEGSPSTHKMLSNILESEPTVPNSAKDIIKLISPQFNVDELINNIFEKPLNAKSLKKQKAKVQKKLMELSKKIDTAVSNIDCFILSAMSTIGMGVDLLNLLKSGKLIMTEKHPRTKTLRDAIGIIKASKNVLKDINFTPPPVTPENITETDEDDDDVDPEKVARENEEFLKNIPSLDNNVPLPKKIRNKRLSFGVIVVKPNKEIEYKEVKNTLELKKFVEDRTNKSNNNNPKFLKVNSRKIIDAMVADVKKKAAKNGMSKKEMVDELISTLKKNSKK